MALSANALTTVAQVKAHAGIDAGDTSKDTLIEWMVNACSDFIAKLCKRAFAKTDYTLKLDGDGTTELLLPHYPIVTITSVKIDDTIIAPSDYKSYVDSGIVYRPAGWDIGRQNIEVVFRAGWALPKDVGRDLPYDIEMACVRMVAKVLDKRLAEGEQNSSAGGLSVSWQSAMDAEVGSVIKLYKRHRV